MQATMERVGARGNTSDMDAQPFYSFITKTYPLHVVAGFAALWALGGLPAVVWGGALRAVWVGHSLAFLELQVGFLPFVLFDTFPDHSIPLFGVQAAVGADAPSQWTSALFVTYALCSLMRD